MKLFTFNKIKLKQQTKRLSVWFLKLSFKKYRLNNLLMLFYFSNVERQRFFPFSYTFRHDFFYPKNGGRTFFGARLRRLRTSTALSFSAIPRVDKLLTERAFFVLFSQDTSVSFLPSFKKKLRSHPILTELRFTRDMLIKTVWIWFDCKIVALKDQ